jgi:Uncharacterized membrane protein, putative virulence factor
VAKKTIKKENITEEHVQGSTSLQSDGDIPGQVAAVENMDVIKDEEPATDGHLASDEGDIAILPETVGGSPAADEPVLSVVAVAPSVPDEQVVQESQESPQASQVGAGRRELVRSALLVALGNLGSSVLGLFRQTIVSSTGVTISSSFFASLSPAQKFNDFLINGSVQGALIPTFNDYANRREELRRIVFTIVNLVFIIMALAAIGYFFVAPWFVYHILAAGFNAREQIFTLQFTRVVFFSLLGLGPFAVLQAALYAQKEFGWTAFAASAYHGGIILGAIFTEIVGDRLFGLGNYGLPLGVVVGALGEVALLIPGMRHQHLRYMFVLDLKHPALRRILWLYGPVAFSFFLSAGFALFDQFLATQSPCVVASISHAARCGDINWTAMQNSTTLIQFPGGLVASALSFAVLPTLTTFIRTDDIEHFKQTLLLGFRLGLLLMIPAAAGIIVLKTPIVALIFQHGKFTPYQTIVTAAVLQNYAYQLPFLAIDQLLIAAFYARKNTTMPVLAYVVGVIGYLCVALPFWNTLGAPALAFANAVQNTVHAIFLLLVLWRIVGSLHLRSMLPALGKILCAAAVLVFIAWGLQWLMAASDLHIFAQDWFMGRLIVVLVAGGLAAAAYFGVAILLKVEEVALLKGAVLAKLGKR